MRTLVTYCMLFPRRTTYVLIALLAAGIAEGLSLTALLPLLSIAVGDTGNSDIGRRIVQTLHGIDIEPTIGVMLLIIVGGMILKSLILLLANRQVGYTVAHVATSLRLEFIGAPFASKMKECPAQSRSRSTSCAWRFLLQARRPASIWRRRITLITSRNWRSTATVKVRATWNLCGRSD